MANIMINCPVMNRPVPTGISMDKNSFESSSFSGNSFKCPVCYQMHTWNKKDAFLQESAKQK